jgi:hypothetical protein
MPGTYDDLDWVELPEEARKAAELLGFDKAMWDHDDCPDELENCTWDDLSDEQKAAATTLGYDKESWEEDDA